MTKLILIMIAAVAIFVSGCTAKKADAQCCGQSVVLTDGDFEINLPCAVQAAAAVRACRNNGGKFFGCLLIEGFGTYLDCNGGLRVQRRAARYRTRSNARASRTQARAYSRCR